MSHPDLGDTWISSLKQCLLVCTYKILCKQKTYAPFKSFNGYLYRLHQVDPFHTKGQQSQLVK